jgi:predicted RecA/RadA family phage recombinase
MATEPSRLPDGYPIAAIRGTGTFIVLNPVGSAAGTYLVEVYDMSTGSDRRFYRRATNLTLKTHAQTVEVGEDTFSIPFTAGGAGEGDMIAAVYDPTSVQGDAFDMDNMVEGSLTKILTAAERTKLSGIENNADVTDAANVAAAGAFMLGTHDSDNITEGATNLFFLAAERTKLSGIEALADVTDAANVAAAGAFMLASHDSDDITEGTTKLFLTTSERSKLSAIEAGADVTDAANVAAAGAFMKVSDTSDDVVEGLTNLYMLAAERTKLGHITVTQAVDLDALEAAIIGGGGITAVVDDTSPQLGGNLDLNGFVITGLVIGTNVQAYNANLTTYAGIAPSANVQSLLGAANYAGMRTLLDLEAGTDFYSIAAANAAFQPIDAELTAIAGLTSAADRLPYFTGAGTASLATFTSVARTLVSQTTQALMRTAGLGMTADGSALVAATDYAAMRTALSVYSTTQTDSAISAAVAALVDSSPGTLDTLNELAAALGDDPNFATTITNSLANKQPLDSELTAIAGLTSAADRLPYFTGAGTASLATFTSVARTLVSQTTQSAMLTTGLGLTANGQSLVTAANYAAMKTLLDVESGTDFLSPAAIAAAYQPLDAELTSIAGLTSAADRLPYFTGLGTAALATFTSVARTLVSQTTQSLMLTAGLGLSANGQSLVTAANYAAMKTLLDVESGTDFLSPAAIAAAYQPLDAELTALAGLTSAADALPYFTGVGTASTTTLSSVGRTLISQTTQALMRTTGLGMSANGSSLVSAADYAAMRTLLTLVVGTNVQAYNANLTTFAAIAPSANVQSLLGAATYAAMRTQLDLEAGTDFYSIAAANAAFQPLLATLTSWGAITRASGFDTFVAAPSSANLRALLSDEVGTGAAYFVGGALGTPASATLTNATGLPVSGITASTSLALGVGTLELGHASDTTLARSAAGFLSVEGNVQARRDPVSSSFAAGFTLALTDGGAVRWNTAATAITVLVPTNAAIPFPLGTVINLLQEGASGSIVVDGDTGVTINGVSGGTVTCSTRWQGLTLFKQATDTWIVSGAID